MTPDDPTEADLDRRRDRAVAAARTVAEQHGVAVEEPRVLHDLFSVVVHLAPAPLVVRTPTVLPGNRRRDPDRVVTERRAELTVATALHRAGFPTIPPSPLLPPEPLVHDGFVLTGWTFVEHRPDVAPPDPAGMVAELHAALRGVESDLGELPDLGFWDESVRENLEALEHRPDLLAADDLARAWAQWRRAEAVLGTPEAFTAAFPHAVLQPVHGDAPTHNVVTTEAGPLVADLETVTRAPVEWDLTLTDGALRDAYDAAAADRGAPPLDRDLLAVLDEARWVQVVGCLALAPQARPFLLEGLRGMLPVWRASTGA